jgi:dihydropteroate synthase
MPTSAATSAAELGDVTIGARHPVRIMAALNVSPESFYGGSVRLDDGALVETAQAAVAAGADIIDIGAMTTAPYLQGAVSADEERRRLTHAVDLLVPSVKVPVSADTQRAVVAAAALDAGATVINDVSGFRLDPEMAAVAARARGVVLTASQMGNADTAGAPMAVIRRLLRDSLARAHRAGVDPRRIVLDPGIGFFIHADVSAAEITCSVLARLGQLADLGHPLLVGVSRKSFITKIAGAARPEDRLAGSLSATAIAVFNGAAIVRTHDVAATRDAIRIAEAIRDQKDRPAVGPRE